MQKHTPVMLKHRWRHHFPGARLLLSPGIAQTLIDQGTATLDVATQKPVSDMPKPIPQLSTERRTKRRV